MRITLLEDRKKIGIIVYSDKNSKKKLPGSVAATQLTLTQLSLVRIQAGQFLSISRAIFYFTVCNSFLKFLSLFTKKAENGPL